MDRTRATTVVKAAVRFKMLAKRAQEKREAQHLAVEGDPENGLTDALLPTREVHSRPTTPRRVSCDGGKMKRLSMGDTLLDVAASDDAGSQLPWYVKDRVAVSHMITSSWFNVLLVCVPLGILSAKLEWGPVPTFCLNFFALIPLALLLGDVTEDLAVRFGDTVGGLLNATFGNVVEMILSIAALLKGLYKVVCFSLLGSILSNLLLVLGCCFLFGGWRHKVQKFNAVANQASSSLLFLSCIGIIIPTTAGYLEIGPGGGGKDAVLAISRGAAIVLLLLYVAYLAFQLLTHHHLFINEDEEEDPTMTLPGALFMLTAITLLVTVNSEYLTGTIESFVSVTGLSADFVGIIILPIAGNACEHITAVIVALKNKMDLSMGVAVGSSIQIAIFAIPFVVLVGWVTGHPLTLDFDPLATLALTLSVVHANFVTASSSSNWLMGVQLIAVYVLLAMVFLYR